MMTTYSRYTILPSYPPTLNSYANEHLLLLTNVSVWNLSEEQLQCRSTHGFYQSLTNASDQDHEHFLVALSRQWNINKDILQYNFDKLMKLIRLLGANRRHLFATQPEQEYLPEHEYTYALEFYLQMDLHLFFMKTCSFRGAESLLQLHGSLFSSEHESIVRYRMEPCQQLSCGLCYPLYPLTYRQQQLVVDFQSSGQHRFLNGYRTILNCPAQCTTQNIIYVLTCPCQQVDYIGETSVSLAKRLSYHQAHGNRILQEFLIGQKNVAHIRPKDKSSES